MDTQTNTRTFLGNDKPKIQLYVVFAATNLVDSTGEPVQRIPIDLVDSDGMGRAMVLAAEEFSYEFWTIEYIDSDTVSAEDMARLNVRLAERDPWPEYIGLQPDECELCGGTGYLEMCTGSEESTCYMERGDCPGCLEEYNATSRSL